MEPLARPLPAAALPLDAAGRIDTDVVCRKCGYNLRGLRPDGVCPECATAVGRSLHGDLLRFCDPDWVRTLASGMNWIVAGIVAGVVMGCIGGGFASVLFFARPRAAALPTAAAGFVASLLAFIGYWKVTTPDPGHMGGERTLSARKLVRVSNLVGLLAFPVAVATDWGPPVFRASVFTGTTIIGIAGFFAIFIYARQLALRIPDEELARSTRIVMWGIVSIVALFGIMGISAAVLMATSPPLGGFLVTTAPATAPTGVGWAASANQFPATMPAMTTVALPPGVTARMAASGSLMGMAGCGAVVGALVFGIWSLLLIGRYRKALRDSADLARRTWAIQARPAG